ncbi:MAG: hypothetical protein ACREC6_06845 [Hyphomicrobiaceae bacterium]
MTFFRLLSGMLALGTGAVSFPGCISNPPPPQEAAAPAGLIEPAAKAPVRAGKDRQAAPPGKEKLAAAPDALSLDLTYAQRLLVPKGSDLQVVIRDQDGKTIFTRRTRTQADGPPYPVSVPLEAPVYPLLVEATLKSKTGHLFTETVEVKDRSAAQLPIRIMLQMQ